MKILLFENVYRVMQAEKALLAVGIGCEMLPTPKEHSKECGMCIGVDPADMRRARDILGDLVRAVVDGKGGRP